MTPTFQSNSASLYLGDCLEVMPYLDAGGIDMVLCDLPYGITACEWDQKLDLQALWLEYRRLLKSAGSAVLTAINPFAAELIASNPGWFRYDWCWEKTSAKGHMSAKTRPLRAHELVLVFGRGAGTYNPQMWRVDEALRTKRKTLTFTGSTGVYGTERKQRKLDDGSRYPRSVVRFGNAHSKIKARNFHPTQKPVALLEYLICTYTNEGDVVLDCCMGSGSTGVACMNTGRRFIGIEKDPDYYATAERRIRSALAPPDHGPLFAEQGSAA